MQAFGVNELRRKYLEFFESKGHLKMNSFSLVPHNDNSLLLINAGMAPLKPYFTGQEIPPRRRVRNVFVQEILRMSVRRQDILLSLKCSVTSHLEIILSMKLLTGHGNSLPK